MGAAVTVETTVRLPVLLEGQLRRILTGMKRWYLYLIAVLLGLVILASLIVRLNSPINFADIWSRDNQAKNTQSDVAKMPAVDAVPRDVLAHSVRIL